MSKTHHTKPCCVIGCGWACFSLFLSELLLPCESRVQKTENGGRANINVVLYSEVQEFGGTQGDSFCALTGTHLNILLSK